MNNNENEKEKREWMNVNEKRVSKSMKENHSN